MYRTLARGADAVAETEVKRSRFLAVVRRVDDEEAARALVEQLRREHHDARHHCSAFVLGAAPATERSNDDGEPAGTAGMPMLEVLRGAGLSDVVAVVVRWFGGIKLGTGGLVRAYADAVQQALATAVVVQRTSLRVFDLHAPHADAGRLEAELRSHGVTVTGTSYGADAVLHLCTNDPPALADLVAAASAGTGRLEARGTRWVDLQEE